MDRSLTSSAPRYWTTDPFRSLGKAVQEGPALPILVAILVLIAWEVSTWLFAIPEFILPPPSAIWNAGLSQPPSIWAGHIWATLQVVLLGLGISIVMGGCLAVALALSRNVDRALMPLLIMIQSTPIVALAPILIVSLGAGSAARTVIVVLITFFPLVIGIATGIRATPPEVIELSRSLHASTSRRLWQVQIPFALPHAFAALKVAVTLAVIGAVVAEFVAADAGLGYAIKLATSYFRMPQAFFALGLLIAISLLLFGAVTWLQRRFFGWTCSSQSRW